MLNEENAAEAFVRGLLCGPQPLADGIAEGALKRA